MNTAAPSPEALAELEAHLMDLLDAQPGGLSEHELLKILRRRSPLFARFNAREPLSLFRGHYLLFHALYRLRDRLIREQRGRLTIDPLRIVLEPTVTDSETRTTALAEPESDWGFCYADARRLVTVTAAEVAGLLNQFHSTRRADGQRRAALATLGLREPVDAATIKRQYRRLAMRHHPDRGGDGQRLGEINAALAVLENDFGR